MPRLFVGLEVPDEITSYLSRVRGGLPGARWVDPADYHLTLRFIGDIDRRIAREVEDELARLRASRLRSRLVVWVFLAVLNPTRFMPASHPIARFWTCKLKVSAVCGGLG